MPISKVKTAYFGNWLAKKCYGRTIFKKNQAWVFEMVNNILIEVLGTIAQQERAYIRQRQAEGIEAARIKGVHLGRPKAQKPNNWNEIISQWKTGNITAKKAMALTGVKHSTFYNLLKS